MHGLSFYVRGHSVLHRLHPSIKLIGYLVYFALIYLLDWPQRWQLSGILFTILLLSGIPPWRYTRFAVITFAGAIGIPVLNGLWSTPDDPILFVINSNFAIHEHGLVRGLSFGGLYVGVGLATVAWLTTTQIWEIAESPTIIGVHHSVGFFTANVFRTMPEIVSHYFEMVDVWRTRGVRFNTGPIWVRFWWQCKLLAMLLLLEFARLRVRTNALEARGFDLHRAPTPFIVTPLSRWDRALIVCMLLGIAIFASYKLISVFV